MTFLKKSQPFFKYIFCSNFAAFRISQKKKNILKNPSYSKAYFHFSSQFYHWQVNVKNVSQFKIHHRLSHKNEHKKILQGKMEIFALTLKHYFTLSSLYASLSHNLWKKATTKYYYTPFVVKMYARKI